MFNTTLPKHSPGFAGPASANDKDTQQETQQSSVSPSQTKDDADAHPPLHTHLSQKKTTIEKHLREYGKEKGKNLAQGSSVNSRPSTIDRSSIAHGTDLLDADLPYKKRQSVREQWERSRNARDKGKAPARAPSGPQDAPTQRRAARASVETKLWYGSQQRRDEFRDLLVKHNMALPGDKKALSGPAFFREIRSLTDAVHPLTDVRLPTQRDDIRLFRIHVSGSSDDVYVLRRDVDGELHDLRRLMRVDKQNLDHVIAQMESSAFMSHSGSATVKGKSVHHPHLGKLWEGGLRKQEFQALYSAYRRLPGKLDTTGGSFLFELYQLTISAKERGFAQDTRVEGIQLFNVQVPGTSGPVQVLCRLDAAGKLADIRLASPATLEEILDQMVNSHVSSYARSVQRVSSAPRQDLRVYVQWRTHLEKPLAGALENFRLAQPDNGLTDFTAFFQHLDELCDKNPGETIDDRFGITRHIVTPLGSKQPITLLRRKDEGELARMRVIDNDGAENVALRSLRSVGPKRKPDVAINEGPDKRRKTQRQTDKLVRPLAGKMTKDDTHLAGTSNRPSEHRAPANVRLQSSTAGKPLHKVIVPQQHKEKTVDITYLVTGAAGRTPRGLRTLEWAYANSPELIRPPRSYEGDRERQVLRWLCTALLKAFPGGREVQAYYDHESDKIWISSNSRGANRKIRQLLSDGSLQGELQKQIQTGEVKPNSRDARHASKLYRMLTDRSARHPNADPVLEAIAKCRFHVPTENFRIDGATRKIDLHAERRIKHAFESSTNTTTIDPTKVVGTKRACGTCADELQLPDSERRGPFWKTRAATAFVDMTSVINDNLAKGIPTHISRGRDEKLNLLVSDSDSDA